MLEGQVSPGPQNNEQMIASWADFSGFRPSCCIQAVFIFTSLDVSFWGLADLKWQGSGTLRPHYRDTWSCRGRDQVAEALAALAPDCDVLHKLQQPLVMVSNYPLINANYYQMRPQDPCQQGCIGWSRLGGHRIYLRLTLVLTWSLGGGPSQAAKAALLAGAR